jgi:hypothetical protein
MIGRKILWACALVAGLAACGGRIAEDDRNDAGDAGAPSVTVPTSTATGAPTAVPTATATATGAPAPDGPPELSCGMPMGKSYPYHSREQLADLLIGKWIYCTGDGRVGPSDVVGFEIAKDGLWYFLRRDSGGELVRAMAAGYRGRWVILDFGEDRYQLDLDVDSGGGPLISQTLFTDGPRRVHLHHDGAVADYLAVP